MYKANIEYAVGKRLERSYQKSKEIGYIDTPETIEEEWTESDEQELDIELRKLIVESDQVLVMVLGPGTRGINPKMC